MTEPTSEEWIPIPTFPPEPLPLADAFTFGEPDDVVPGAPATISVDLNADDVAYVYLAIEPPGVARLLPGGDGLWLRESIGLDLRPAEAAELATRLRACAEAAAAFAARYPDEPDPADEGAPA